MDKDIVIGGNWNILGIRYEGELVFNKTNGVILLDIHYVDTSCPIAWYNKPDKFNEITGITNQKNKCILTDCLVVKKQTYFPDRHHVVICAKSLFFGLKNKKQSTLKFNEARFQLSNIFQWTKLNGLEEINNYPKYWIDVVYKPKDKISIKVDEETTIEFVPGMGSFNPDMLVEKLSISQYVSIYIKKKTPVLYEKFFEDLNKVIDLILISTNKNIKIRKIEYVNYKHFNIINGQKDYIKFEVIDNRMEETELITTNNRIDVYNYLFDLPEIVKDNKINKWFDNYDKYRNIYNLFLLSIKNQVPEEIKFCNYMQSIELLHNLKYSRLKKFYRHIDEKLSANHSLIDEIKNDKDQSESTFIILKSRMIDLLKNDYLFISEENIIKLSIVLTDSRNYYTHYNDSKKTKCVVKSNLIYAVFLMNTLLTCYIMETMRFDIKYIKEKMSNNFRLIEEKEMIKNIIENKR